MAQPINITVLKGDGLRIHWMPGSSSGTQHVQKFDILNVTAGNTFKLWINGVITASISVNAAIATTATNIKTALEASDGVGGTWAVSTLGNTITATYSAANVFFNIRLDTAPATGRILTSLSAAGSESYLLSSALKTFSFSETVETVDATPVMQLEEDTIVKRSILTFSFDLYDADASWGYAIFPGLTGVLTVYEEYGAKGTKYFKMLSLLEGVEKQTEGVVEYNVSGRRKGPMIAPLGSIV